MWICMNDSFFSIVNIPGDPDQLKVRARFEGDIEQVFGPNVRVRKTPHRDYLYRAYVDRRLVAEVLSKRIENINYPNFKDSVLDQGKHDAYSDVWGVMYEAQWGNAGVMS